MLFCQVICEFPLLPALCPFFYTNMLLADLLSPAPACPVAASCPLCHCFNNRVRKLHQKEIKEKKTIFGNLLPMAATLPAPSFGFTMWEFPTGRENSQFIQRHWRPLCPSSQPAELEAGVIESPPLGKCFPVPAPQGGSRASLPHTHRALQLEVSL